MMKSFLATMALMATAASAVNSDAFATLEQICQEHGFATESRTLTTEDGYVLSLYRIPGTFEEIQEGMPEKPAVLITHAQDCDMMEWVWNDYERANAFILANAGYDVWLANNRGNKYSNTHLTLDPSKNEYWDFYQEDMGLKDLPTFIDEVLSVTGHDTLSYIGHSEGTTQMFLGASLNPDYFNSKVNIFLALAPVASTANIPTWFIRDAARIIDILKFALVDVIGYANWFAPMHIADELVAFACDFGLTHWICHDLAKLMHNDEVDNGDRFDVFISNEPSGQSYRTFVYYAQMINNGGFTLYDYGKSKNQEVYGQATAPNVPLENYSLPTALFSGDLDDLADPVDVAWLSETLGDKVVFQKQYHLDHFSFAIAKDMSWFQTDAIAVLQKYNPVTDPKYLQ